MVAGEESVLPFVEAVVGGVKHEGMVDSGATDGALIDEVLGRKLRWVTRPSEVESCLSGIMDGAYARWGEAVINVGGREVTLPVGVTSALNGKIPFLLGNGVLESLGVRFDWEKHEITPKGGERVPFVLRRMGAAAHLIYMGIRTRVEASKRKWNEVKAPRKEAEVEEQREVKGKEKGETREGSQSEDKRASKVKAREEERQEAERREKDQVWASKEPRDVEAKEGWPHEPDEKRSGQKDKAAKAGKEGMEKRWKMIKVRQGLAYKEKDEAKDFEDKAGVARGRE